MNSTDEIPSSPSLEALSPSLTDPACNVPENSKFTFFNGLALVLGLQIGSGIFSVPSQVSLHVHSPGEGVLVWIVAGLLAWTGASSFIELGMAIPCNGGIQEYLQFCYGDFAGLLFAWMWVFVVKPSANATIATILANYLATAVSPVDTAPLLLSKLIGVIAIAVIAGLNCAGTKAGPKVANAFLILKLLLVTSIVTIGMIACWKNGKGVPSSESGWFGTVGSTEPTTWTRFGSLVTALFGALFCYGGWESIGFVLGDMENPRQNLPRLLNSAMIITISSFTLVVITFYLCLPLEVIRANNALALEFGKGLLGPVGKSIYALAVAISALGAINTNIFASAKLCVTASQRGYFPDILSDTRSSSERYELLHTQSAIENYPSWLQSAISALEWMTATWCLNNGAPIYGILLNAFLSMLYVIVGTFNGLLVFVGLSEYLIFFFCVVGVFVMRQRRKSTAGPDEYRTWTLNPVLFVFMSGLLVLRGIFANFLQGIAILIVFMVAWIFYVRNF